MAIIRFFSFSTVASILTFTAAFVQAAPPEDSTISMPLSTLHPFDAAKFQGSYNYHPSASKDEMPSFQSRRRSIFGFRDRFVPCTKSDGTYKIKSQYYAAKYLDLDRVNKNFRLWPQVEYYWRVKQDGQTGSFFMEAVNIRKSPIEEERSVGYVAARVNRFKEFPYITKDRAQAQRINFWCNVRHPDQVHIQFTDSTYWLGLKPPGDVAEFVSAPHARLTFTMKLKHRPLPPHIDPDAISILSGDTQTEQYW